MDESEFHNRMLAAGLSAEQSAVKAGMFAEAAKCLLARGVSREHIFCAFVPGRIEFLGKHTDYAGGRSLVCALERGFCVAAAARSEGRVRITDAGRREDVEFDLKADLIPAAGHWSNYPMTVASRIAENFPGAVRGADIAFISDLPPAAGVSSSSALVIGIFFALARVNALQDTTEYLREIHSLEDLAGYLGTVENGQSFGSLTGSKGVGTFGGSQDHTAILCCVPSQLSQYSFCPVRFERAVALPRDHVFVIGVSGVAAAKTGDALAKYNRASLTSAEILAIWRSVTGRDDSTLMAAVTSSAIAPARMREALRNTLSSSFGVEELLNRFEQFLAECLEIIPGVADALAADKVEKIGELVDRSQLGAERGLANQVPETITLVRLAREFGAVAASAFGAGFGGSVWALVKNDCAQEFKSKWADEYRSRFPRSAAASEFFLTAAGPSMISFAS